MKKIAALTLSLFLTYGTAFADTPKDTPKDADAQPAKPATPAKPKAATKTDKTDSAIAAEIEELRQTLQSQQEQLSLLKEELAKRDRQIDEARDAAAAANARAAEATTKATEAVNTTAAVKSTADTLNTKVADLSASNEELKTTVATTAAAANGNGQGGSSGSEDGPVSISYKGVRITPGGFIAAETVFRNRATSDDINTQFTGIPYPSLAIGKLPENVFSARQTRLSALVETNIASAKVTGYVETDFLGAAVTSNNRQSNSYVLRMRQLWARAAWENGFAVSGGQMWSLVTEDKKGIENRQEQFPMMIDPQYIVGWAWQRAYGFRVTKSFDDKLTVAASVEGPQTTIGGRGFADNFFVDAPGQAAGLNNAFDTTGYTINKSPDFLVKAALDPGWGHYEVVGILSPFRDRVYPCGALPLQTFPTATCTGATSVAGAYNASATGGGVGATARLPVVKQKVDVMIHFQGGDGIGRYSSAQLSDVTARPDGTLAPIRTAAYLTELELHPSPKFDIFAYYGGEYAARTDYTYLNADGNPVPVGYGSPLFNNSGCATETAPTNDLTPGAGGTCNGDVHQVIEGTLGFWHNVYQGSKGRLRWGMTYSYVTKIGWSANDFNTTTGIAGVSVRPKAVDNMVFTSFRYYLP